MESANFAKERELEKRRLFFSWKTGGGSTVGPGGESNDL
jgi:hypothetical protein